MFRQLAHEDFWRAYRRAFWRKLSSWITGKNNELLPYHQVRQEIPFQGQRDLGLQTIPIEKIVGSVGRYRDFDRAFLPTQRQTSQRWVNISAARYADVELPPIEAYKLGEVYFVKDGNHRVSVARERGQALIDAYVTEITLPIALTPDTAIDDLKQKRAYAHFMQRTGLSRLRPEANLELSMPEEYGRLLNHIDTHRYYLGLEQQRPVSYEEAVISWYDNVYLPLVELIKDHGLPQQFPQRTLTDLYWWVSEYQWLRRESTVEEDKVEEAVSQLADIYTNREVRQALRKLRQATWIDDAILQQEQAHFDEYTRIREIRPEADIRLTLPGKYEKMLAHISDHRWYLGEERGADVPYDEAVASWYDNIYAPIVQIIREQGFLEQFANRTEADLYLWTLDHRSDLKDAVLEHLAQMHAEDEEM